MNESATRAGTAAARVTLPALPDDCRKVEPHAPVVVGADPVSVLKRERGATDRANARVIRCAENYDNVARALR
nr:hypothetical protein [Ensifer aridi]